ncbi:MAG: type II 3-dehydroquinate dehydratase [Acholeplasmataceae bacterium]|nr:3-dehydroquinate dehydratase [Acholeplasmataceae bacterium]
MKILCIHGPNLNMLGKRSKTHYGELTLDQIYESLIDTFEEVEFTFYQSNHEGEILDLIHASIDEDYDGLLINPGALCHQSIALRDALEILTIPKVEVHLSNINEREDFRKINYIKDVCQACFMGKKIESYHEAVQFFLHK